MKVLLAGDTHGNIRHVKSLIEIAVYEGCDRIVQLGDFGFWPHIEDFDAQVNRAAMEAGITFYWLDGNHENFDQLEKEVDFNSAHPQQMYANLWYLPRGSTWEWDGCRFMALGGAYSIDKHRRVEGHSWWPQELITSAQVERAVSRGQVDIMLTHDTPEGGCPIPVISLFMGRAMRFAEEIGWLCRQFSKAPSLACWRMAICITDIPLKSVRLGSKVSTVMERDVIRGSLFSPATGYLLNEGMLMSDGAEKTWVMISIENEHQGSSEELGLDELPEGFTADDVVTLLKSDSRGGPNDRSGVIRDWDLIDNPVIRVQVSQLIDGKRVNTHADWGFSDYR